jgi:alpha-glucosidase
VPADFLETLAFWLAMGVDGFRIDVGHFLVKDRGLPDLTDGWDQATADDGHPFADREGLHAIYRSWRRLLDEAGRPITTCAEIDLPAERVARYLRPGELHTSFNFDLLHRPWHAGPMRRSIERTLATHGAVGAPATWVIGNHDLPRPSFRLGWDDDAEDVNPWTRQRRVDQGLGLRRARAAALLAFALPGVAYIWQGDELGLPEVLDLPGEARQDPTFRLTGGVEIGRDGDRVPVPWSGTEPPYGFGPDGSVPWLPQPASWAGLSVEAQLGDPSSTLTLYRDALALRRRHPGLAGGAFAWLDDDPTILHFERNDGFCCLVNLGSGSVELPAGAQVLLRSDGHPGDGQGPGSIPLDTAAWYVR